MSSSKGTQRFTAWMSESISELLALPAFKIAATKFYSASPFFLKPSTACTPVTPVVKINPFIALFGFRGMLFASGCAHKPRSPAVPAEFSVFHPDVGEVTSSHPAYQMMRSDCTDQSYVPIEINGELVSADSNSRSAWLNYRNETINELVRRQRMGDFAEGAAITSVARKNGLTQVGAWGDTNTRIRLAHGLFKLMEHPPFFQEISGMMDAHAACIERSGWRRI